VKRTIALVILSLIAGVAAADDEDHRGDGDRDRDHGKHVVSAPEIDPAGAAAAFTLLAGGVAVLRGRRGKK
jgi:hypothetical protein